MIRMQITFFTPDIEPITKGFTLIKNDKLKNCPCTLCCPFETTADLTSDEATPVVSLEHSLSLLVSQITIR